jgi:hypothetical protein
MPTKTRGTTTISMSSSGRETVHVPLALFDYDNQAKRHEGVGALSGALPGESSLGRRGSQDAPKKDFSRVAFWFVVLCAEPCT